MDLIRNFASEELKHTLAALQNQNWVGIFVIILITFASEKIISFVLKKIYMFTHKKQKDINKKAIRTIIRAVSFLIYLTGTIIVVNLINYRGTALYIKEIIIKIIKLLFISDIIYALWNLTEIFGNYLFNKITKTSSKIDDQLAPVFVKTLQIFILSIGLVYVIDTLGYSVSGIITGLGIGGLAVAMAAKDTLSNFFGSVMIIIDHPFKIGDWIKINSDNTVEGIVEKIGFRSTRIRTFDKTLITIPNSVVANATINNFSRMPLRRIKFSIGLTYDTPKEKIPILTEKITEYLTNHPDISKDNIAVKFYEFNSSSLDILISYYTHKTSWLDYLKVKEEVNLNIMRIVHEENLEFAFPTQTIYLEKTEN